MAKRACVEKPLSNIAVGRFDDLYATDAEILNLTVETQAVEDGTAGTPSISNETNTAGVNFNGAETCIISSGNEVLCCANNEVVIGQDTSNPLIELNTPIGSIASPNVGAIYLNDARSASIYYQDRRTDSFSSVQLRIDNADHRVELRSNGSVTFENLTASFLSTDGNNGPSTQAFRVQYFDGMSTLNLFRVDSFSSVIGVYPINFDTNTAPSTTVDRLYKIDTGLYYDKCKLNTDNVVSSNGPTLVLTLENDIIRSTALNTITLPDASTSPGKRYHILNTAAHNTTIDVTLGDFIDDGVATSITLTAANEHVTLVSDGVSLWMIV